MPAMPEPTTTTSASTVSVGSLSVVDASSAEADVAPCGAPAAQPLRPAATVAAPTPIPMSRCRLVNMSGSFPDNPAFRSFFFITPSLS